MDLTPQKIRELLDYDPLTGMLTWRTRPLRSGLERIDKGWNTRLAGRPAGMTDRNGHIWVTVEMLGRPFRKYSAHRLAWAHYHDEWPTTEDVDHINGNPSDNRMINLRPASTTENVRNQRRRIDNTSGHKGISWSKKSKKWYAYINVDKRMIALGLFASKEEAIAVRRAAAKQFFGEFAREDDVIGLDPGES